MKAGKLRHVVNVMRPAEPAGDVPGKSPPTIHRAGVYCSIEQLTGREAERFQQMYATATLKVKMWGDPSKPLRAVDWLEELPSKNRLNILNKDDLNRNGIELELICGEEPK